MSLTCKDVMERDIQSLKPTDSVHVAFELIRQDGHRFLPVLDEEGKYLGVFTAVTLMRNLLPSAATINMDNELLATPEHLHFYNLSDADLKARVRELEQENVMDYLSEPKNIPMANPDTPLMQVMLLLNRYKRHVIVVEPETHKLVGIATTNHVLNTLFS